MADQNNSDVNQLPVSEGTLQNDVVASSGDDIVTQSKAVPENESTHETRDSIQACVEPTPDAEQGKEAEVVSTDHDSGDVHSIGNSFVKVSEEPESEAVNSPIQTDDLNVESSKTVEEEVLDSSLSTRVEQDSLDVIDQTHESSQILEQPQVLSEISENTEGMSQSNIDEANSESFVQLESLGEQEVVDLSDNFNQPQVADKVSEIIESVTPQDDQEPNSESFEQIESFDEAEVLEFSENLDEAQSGEPNKLVSEEFVNKESPVQDSESIQETETSNTENIPELKETPTDVKDESPSEEQIAEDIVETVIKEATLENTELPQTIEKPIQEDKPDVVKSQEDKPDVVEAPEDEWLDVLGNQLLKKKVVSAGSGGKPERGEEVTIEYECSNEDGSVYEAKQLLTFVIAEGEVCEALDLSVNLMEKDEKCTVISDVKYCYNKDKERPSTLPMKGNLSYNICLKSIDDGPYNTSVSVDKRLKWVEKKKLEGNSFYGRKVFKASVNTYRRCLRVLNQVLNQQDVEETVKVEVRKLAVKCYNNIAASYLQLADWRLAVRACTDAEALDSNNVKTLLRKGKALSQLGQDTDAVGVLKKAAKIDPEAKDVQNELSKVTKKLTAQKEAQKKMCERMFGGGQTSKKAEEKTPFSWKSAFGYGSSAVMLAAVLLGLFMYQKQ